MAGAHRDGFPDYADNSTPGRHLRGSSSSPTLSRVAEFTGGANGLSASQGRAQEAQWGGQTNSEPAPNYIFGGRY